LRKNESTPEEVSMTTLTCLVLHNKIICIAKGDTIPAALDLTFDHTTNAKKSSEEIRDELHMTKCRKIRNSHAQAKKVKKL
jgi:predicted ThiF/HesA family dinucleotide-utilizing enzyme